MTQVFSRTATTRAVALLTLATLPALAQDRLKLMPGYERYARLAPQIATALGGNAGGQIFGGRGGGGGVTWAADSKSVEYVANGRRMKFDLDAKRSTETSAIATQQGGGRGRGGGVPARGRQFEFAIAPAGNHRPRGLEKSESMSQPRPRRSDPSFCGRVMSATLAALRILTPSSSPPARSIRQKRARSAAVVKSPA